MSLQFFKNYNILCKIGEGSFSEVLKVQSIKTGQVFAAKRLKKMFKDDLDLLTCVELAAIKNMDHHPNVIEIIDIVCDPLPGHLTLIFELMDMSLYEYLKTRKRCPSELKVRLFLYQLICGIRHLHLNGIFHRDIKPENILLKFDSKHQFGFSQIELLKIADMGSACNIYKSPPHTAYISTRWYRAPECLLSHGYYGPKMDIWSLGCVFYEMLTLLPLFPGDNELDQLYRIHDILGTPTISMLSRTKMFMFPKRKPIGLHNLLPATSDDGVDILSRCLIYLPEIRFDISRIANHSYFRNLRTSSSEFYSTPSLICPAAKKCTQLTARKANPLKDTLNANKTLKSKGKLTSVTSRSLDTQIFSISNRENILKQKERIWGMSPGNAKTALIKTTIFPQRRKIK
ncbi:unnamed protein product [Hermetia illucens]|uniref:Protein kinase domain-containing protein n=1 Tax=Hermetia illucens TaxID=343691 RepID=A0A7R8YSS5_HERIL|nr:unnamed protein product [Hermetia illucens]